MTTATTGQALDVEIGAVPSSTLSPNAKPHWGTRARQAKVEREAAYYETRQAILLEAMSVAVDQLRCEDGPITVEITVGWPPGRKIHDADGALGALKPTLDGIADALGVNDKRFRFAPIGQTRAENARGYVRVRVSWEGRAVIAANEQNDC